MNFTDFIQTEIPLRPFVRSDGTAGQTLVRSTNPLAPRELVWTDAGGGSEGKSAYDIACLLGFYGTQAEWIASLGGATGAKGDTGATGKDGVAGISGTNGLSAYEIAVSLGYPFTESQWIASLKGDKGDKGDTGTVDTTLLTNEITRATNVEQAIQTSLDTAIAAEATIRAKADNDLAVLIAAIPAGAKGDTGASAYDIALALGYQGSEGQWLNSLKGKDGTEGVAGKDGINGLDGLSAYQVAVKNGYLDSEVQWLLSLKGTDGASNTPSIVFQTPLIGVNSNGLELLDTIDMNIYSNSVWDVIIQTSNRSKRFTLASLYNKSNNKIQYTVYGIVGDNILHKVSIGYDGLTNALKLYIQNKDVEALVVSALRYPLKSS